MSAERGAQSIEEVRASLRILPGLLHIWGGDGERDADDPPADQPDGDATDQQDPPDGEPDEGAEGDAPEDKSKTPTIEEQLDEEKRLRLKAERELTKSKKAKEDAEADKDAVKDRDKYKSKLEARDKFLTENLLIMEINKQKKYDFIDVEDVINAFKADEVTIDLDADEPAVEGLDLALKRIAKAKPHFLKKSKEEEDDTDGVPSGSKVGSGKQESAEAEAKRLGEKFKIPGYGTQQMKMM